MTKDKTDPAAENGASESDIPEGRSRLVRRVSRADDRQSRRREQVFERRSMSQQPAGGDGTAHHPRVAIYDPADVQRAIRAITGEDDLNHFLPDDDRRASEAHLSSEETLRLKRLRHLDTDRRGPSRSLIRATPEMVERLATVKARAPHFTPFIDLIIRAAQVAIVTDTPLRLPPILLVGEPGIGKTWTLRKVAEAIGSSVYPLAMNTTDSFRIRGLNTAWKGARPGKIVEALLAAHTASPIILLDELDKAPSVDRTERPFDVWHSLWERENAVGFVDDYFEIPFRCDHVIWIAAANSVEPLPASIIDRLLILRVPSPDPAQVYVILDEMYAALRERLGNRLSDKLDGDVRAALALHSPRCASGILDLAVGFMAADRRKALAVQDVARAASLTTAEGDRASSRRVGFIPAHPVTGEA